MDVLTAIRARRSIRKFRDDPVEEEKLRAVLEAARLAPSAANAQETRFVVVRDAAIRERLFHASKGQEFVRQAPVVIAACAETDGRVMTCGQTAYPIDVAISLDHLSLAAWSLGLGTCWVGRFDEKEARDALGVPERIRVVQLMALGVPDEEPAPRPRKPFEEVVHWGTW
jgi:nitroreductase